MGAYLSQPVSGKLRQREAAELVDAIPMKHLSVWGMEMEWKKKQIAFFFFFSFSTHAFLSLVFLSHWRILHQQVTKKEVFEGGDPHLPFGLASMQVMKMENEEEKTLV